MPQLLYMQSVHLHAIFFIMKYNKGKRRWQLTAESWQSCLEMKGMISNPDTNTLRSEVPEQ